MDNIELQIRPLRQSILAIILCPSLNIIILCITFCYKICDVDKRDCFLSFAEIGYWLYWLKLVSVYDVYSCASWGFKPSMQIRLVYLIHTGCMGIPDH